MKRFAVYEDKENCLQGCSMVNCPCPLKNGKAISSRASRELALRDKQVNVVLPQRRTNCVSEGVKSVNAYSHPQNHNVLARQEIRTIFREDREGVYNRGPSLRNIQHQRGDSNQLRCQTTQEVRSTSSEQRRREAPRPRALSSSDAIDYLTTATSSRQAYGSTLRPEDHRRRIVSSSSTRGQHETRPQARIFSSTVVTHQSSSPIQPNRFTSVNTLITRGTRNHRSAKLERRAQRRVTGNRYYVGDIYTKEYLQDIMSTVGDMERKITLPVHFLEMYNPDLKIRASVVDWMLEAQGQISLSEEEFYLSVNLLDQVLARILVPINMYQLLALSTMWIANKLLGSDTMRASTLLETSGNAYQVRQLLKMERKVLKLMNFKIHTIEPTVCVNYYLKLLDIDHLQIARFSVYYILDCATLLPEFSTSRIRVLAAAAVNVAIKIYCSDLEEESNYFFNRSLVLAEIDKRRSLESLMYSQVLNMSKENYMFRQAYRKYSSVTNKMPLH